MKTSRLPESRPDDEDVVIKREVNYEIIVEFVRDAISVTLYLEPHEDYSDITPDEVNQDCGVLVDGSGEPSTVSELPPTYRQMFTDAVRVVEDQYSVTSQYPGTCTKCMPNGNGGTLVYTTFLN